MALDLTRYYRYDELTATLQEWASAHPNLATLQSIGTSHEGRDIWLMTVTNAATGAAEDKPATWLDGNLHATEVTGAMGALHVIERLLTGYGADDAITRLLDTRAFYIVPRVNPDGAEQYLTTPYYLRSGTRSYPFADERDGLYPEDINGDGRIVQMRVEDPDGAWKVSEKDPRLMRRRGPDEENGTYYRVYTEGRIRNYDGTNVPIAPPKQGLDFNRSFPYIWAGEGDQRGAGPYPLSEPETRALVAFITAHPNISGAISYHTYSGAILRPYSDVPDDKMPLDDLRAYQELGQRGTDITGYPHVSVYHGFRYDPRGVMRGAFDDWAYDAQGMFAFTVELWDMVGEAGIKDRQFIEWMRDHPEDDDLKLLAWNDTHLDGKGFINWQPFDHPELGRVEIGGWIERETFGNPPPAFLRPTLEPNTEFVLALARTGPRLELRELSATALGDGLYRVRAVLVNSGYLPTYTSSKARERKVVEPIAATLTLPDGAALESGVRREEIGHLEGRWNKRALFGGSFPTDNLRRLDWVVRAPAGSVVQFATEGGRGGRVRGEVVLGE